VEPNTKDTWIAVLIDGSRVPMSRGGYGKFRGLVGKPVDNYFTDCLYL